MNKAAERRIRVIRAFGRRLTLREAITVTIERSKDGQWLVTGGECLGYGKSKGAALEDWKEDFAAAYDGLIGESDEKLTKGARELRDKLASMVAKDSKEGGEP